jgi:hypothetical protein
MTKGYFQFLGLALLALITLGGLGFVANGMGLMSFSFFAPKVEAVRFKTFKESQSYNDGMLRDLQDLKREYLKADPAHQEALRELTIHRFSVYDINRLPPDLQAFYSSINN